ncbi:hypothetical protein H9X96_18765 [Pedobacter sp. N36a]|uniref:hypothetical protein n=1 Tax=Pedobacter sp. N36a TaxID=2767996 RepID=UPI001656FE2C|nr:hypothetical protein [Pedobacter sp. N36a]MBC8987810.1 hypothetical protein [Pedobacter sp. N36a]
MKKILLLLLCTATLGLASCKKEVIIDPGLPNETIEMTILPGDWTYINDGETLTTTVPFPELDVPTFTNDAVHVYIYPDNAVDEYRPVPFTYNYEAYSCIVRRGSISVDLESTVPGVRPKIPTTKKGLRVVIVTSKLR